MNADCPEQIHFRSAGMFKPATAKFCMTALALLAAAAWPVLQTSWNGSRDEAHAIRSAEATPETRTLLEDCQIRMQPTDLRCD